jgi:hypothetical protein
MIATALLGGAVGLALIGAAMSPWLKEWFRGVLVPKKGGS